MNATKGNAPSLHVWAGRRKFWNSWCSDRMVARCGKRWVLCPMLMSPLASGKAFARAGREPIR